MSEHLPIVAMYMALGADSVMRGLPSEDYEKLVDDRSGHLGLMNDYVLEVAKHVARRLDERGDIEEWAGVFDYEVSEPLGAEIIHILVNSNKFEDVFSISDKMITEFFAK